MPRHSDANSPRRRIGLLMRVALATPAFAVALAGCNVDRLLKVKAPDVVVPGSINNAASLPTVLAGTYGDFGFAFAGDGGDEEGFIQFSGQLGDELFNSETFPTRVAVDRRNTLANNADNLSVYQQMHIARADGERTVAGYIKFQPGAVGEGQALNLVGFAYVLLGEDYCTGQPFSTVALDGSSFVYGQPETTAQVFQDAITRFDSALTVLAADAADDPGAVATATNDALVGKARALLNLGQFDAAATAASTVPTTFADSINYSTNTQRQQNGVFEYFQNEQRITVPNKEGGNGLAYRTIKDPRTPWDTAGIDPRTGLPTTGFDNLTFQFNQLIFPTKGNAIPFASGVEARLIQAEGALHDGNLGGFTANLQAARAQQKASVETVAPLGPPNVAVDTLGTIAVAPATDTGRVNLLFRERAFDLWLTAHRLGDMRRLVRSVANGGYGRDVNTVYPIGAYPKGGVYGTDVSLPVPVQEQNNPNFTSCDTSIP
jgi:hypothetical protein